MMGVRVSGIIIIMRDRSGGVIPRGPGFRLLICRGFFEGILEVVVWDWICDTHYGIWRLMGYVCEVGYWIAVGYAMSVTGRV